MIFMVLDVLPETDGGAVFSLVHLGLDGKPACVDHGAMNKLSAHGIWRCITTTGTSGRRCDAGALEIFRDVIADPECVCNIGVQECALHPGRLLSQEARIAFRKAWDARVREAP